MGMPCHMEPNKGPQFSFALETPEDLKKLKGICQGLFSSTKNEP